MATYARLTPTPLIGVRLISHVALCILATSITAPQATGEEYAHSTKPPIEAPFPLSAAANDTTGIQPSALTAFAGQAGDEKSVIDSSAGPPGLRLRPIGELGVNIAIKPMDDRGRILLMPAEEPADVPGMSPFETAFLDEDRPWPIFEYHWEAPQLCHRPLYFEEINLERYGHSAGVVLQPAFSAAHFYGTVAAMPVLLILEPPCQCVYTLGHFRPGNCVPFELYCPRPRCDREVVTHCCFGECLHCGKLWDPEFWDEVN